MDTGTAGATRGDSSVGHTASTPAQVTRRLRLLPAVAWPIGVILALYFRLSPYGYNPTDDGNILAQTYRILHGQVPHKDVIFARPMGSALFHVIDFVVPLPLFKASRLIGIAELVTYSVLLGALIFKQPIARWRTPVIVCVVTSAFVNMHTYPLMGWYTTDGLLFVAIGLVLLMRGVESERTRLKILGLLALGLAPLMKQSFFAGPIIGLVILLWHSREVSLRALARRFIVAAAIVMAPLATYAIVIGALGGLHAMIRQLTHVHDVGSVFGNAIFHPDKFPQTSGLILVFLGLALLLRLSELFSAGRAENSLAQRSLLPQRVVTTTLLALVPIVSRFGYYTGWSIALFWGLLFFALSELITKRRVYMPYLVVAAVAWMSSLSWGYGIPTLASGSVLIATAHSIWRDAKPLEIGTESTGQQLRFATASLALLVLVTGAFLLDHDARTYFDRPVSALTASLDSVAPAYRGIRTNPVTASYLVSMAQCIRAHPSKWTAVLPDNAGIYPALHLRNPFPIDWMYFAEVQGEESRILAAAKRLNSTGRFLVLFQTYSAYDLRLRLSTGVATRSDHPFDYGLPLTAQISALLGGQRFTCGPFIGVYRPT